jgi:hypothetical protein
MTSHHLLGFFWDGKVWCYCILFFGLNSSVAYFYQFSQFIYDQFCSDKVACWCYIDDLFGTNPSHQGALWDFNRTREFHFFVQVEENSTKALALTQVIDILEYEINTLEMRVHISSAKTQQIIDLCDSFASLHFTTLKRI